MGAYDAAIATAKRLIAAKGRTASMARKIDGTPADPAKPWRPGTPSTESYASDVPMVFLDLRTAQATLFGGKALAPDVTEVALVAAGDMPERPQLKDLVLDGVRRLVVEDFDVLAPGDADVLYTLHLKE